MLVRAPRGPRPVVTRARLTLAPTPAAERSNRGYGLWREQPLTGRVALPAGGAQTWRLRGRALVAERDDGALEMLVIERAAPGGLWGRWEATASGLAGFDAWRPPTFPGLPGRFCAARAAPGAGP